MAIADIQLTATQAAILYRLEPEGSYLQEAGDGSFKLQQGKVSESEDVPTNVVRSLLEAQFLSYTLSDSNRVKITKAGRVWTYWSTQA